MEKSLLIRDLLKKMHKTYSCMIAKELAEYGITMPQMIVMRQIMDGPKTIGQISKAVDLSYSTVSGIVDRMEKARLVERKRDEQDRRVVWIKKMEPMPENLKQIPIFQDHFYAELFQDISAEQKDVLISSLQTIINLFEKRVEDK